MKFCMKKRNKILFIDYNGVLSYKPFWHSLLDSSNSLAYLFEKIEKVLFKQNIEIIRDWMVGKYTTEEIHDFLANNLDEEFSKEELLDVFINDCKKLDISQECIDSLKKLKDEYILILMTDNMDCFDRYTIPAQKDYFDVFDEISNSYGAKKNKRENNCERFFDYIKKYNIQRENCILIDDSLKNCDTFDTHVSGRSFNVTGVEKVNACLQKIKKHLEVI